MNHNINNQVDKVIKELDILEKLLNEYKIKNLMSDDMLINPDHSNNHFSIDQAKTNILLPLINRICHKINHQNQKSQNQKSNREKKIFIKSYLDITHCYICKIKFDDKNMIHDIYKTMCQPCGNINYEKRMTIKDLSGKVAIVTGGRVKIGYETAIKLLKSGCTVICTSRFVDDCSERYMTDKDYSIFKSRLYIYQLNLSDYQSIDKFINYVHNNRTIFIFRLYVFLSLSLS
jgi:3-oxoacyl-ACP reductase-like protein